MATHGGHTISWEVAFRGRPYLHICKDATRCNRTALGMLNLCRFRPDGNFPPVEHLFWVLSKLPPRRNRIFVSTIMKKTAFAFRLGGLDLAQVDDTVARPVYYCSTIFRHSKNIKKSTETPFCSPARLYCFHPFFSVHFKNAGTSLEICPGIALSLTHAGMFPSGLLAVAINHSHPSSPKSLTNSILS
jgi:hypothetical protein